MAGIDIMSNVTQFTFDLLDVAKLLAKQQGIKEGHWTIGIKFNFAAVNAGPNKEGVRPSAFVAVDQLVLTKAEDKDQPLTVDASMIQ
jgi:hypothetical protein